ncbi:hypothetical protein [Clostridium sulfidigenes]|uniref:hypothetical protein n=1 Tax=Clostridium sulfidigenes TaxID=318464 RepID=UPI003F897A95
MNLIFIIIISYLTLYLVIWLHELGHSFFYWKYGCKENWLKVSVKPYLFFSTPAPVDEEKAEHLTTKQNLTILYGGIVVNLFLAFMIIIVIEITSISNNYIELFLYQFVTLHLSEAISYLVLGNIYLVSDMKGIANIKPILRPINFILGILTSVIYFIFIKQIPQYILPVILTFNLIAIICMGVGRIVFTYYYSKKIT